jgi:AcrR family transcriptional regulator
MLLARAAGVNRTSFYEHFASPEDLAIHALSDLLDVVRNADIAMRSQHSVPAAEASRRALHEIVSFVHERRESYVRLLGPGAAPQLMRAVSEALLTNQRERTEPPWDSSRARSPSSPEPRTARDAATR